ncbi:SDR family oxidoreductase [Gleimia sp. 6138-11-ORH1]|uniref:SDR family oxidoreductase n=1 Tax=Gleimia sp. 6138-11-ORH1 TaxID=2973937 RepID=UPI00216726B7|nr:SDR family oxidoreductase [Gleimia sp. 6138-11-ORH1]MCS4484316.1 SDR family oxidoreductase [Gleimia sp. 6138-11-ORH1]
MRKVLVTGATGGIGRAICSELAEDTHLLVGGRDPEKVTELVASLPSAEPFIVDLTDESALENACAQISELDGLIHNAGIAFVKSVLETSHTDWEQMFALNVISTADLTRQLLPVLRKAKGQVIFINSGAGLKASPGWAAYAASKFALRAFADSLREEERGKVRVSSIHPGRVDTQMQVAIQASMDRPYDPGEHLQPSSVAKAVRAVLDASAEAFIGSLSIAPLI